MFTIPQRIEIVRNALGFKKKDFCERIGISQNAYSNYVNGRVPTIEILKKMIDEFGINGHWLMTGEGVLFGAPAATAPEPARNPGGEARNTHDQEYVIELLEENRQLRRRVEEWVSRYNEMLEHAAELEEDKARLLESSAGAGSARGSGGHRGGV